MKTYDLIVIGSGAGAKIARPAAQLGFKTAIIEKDKLGGTCLNRGCIPSKMLIHPADLAQEIHESKKFYFNVKQDFTVTFSKLTKHINKVTDTDSNNIKHAYESGKIKKLDYYNGEAKFLSDYVIEVNGKKITSKKIVIAVGARPNVPPIPGLKDTPFMTSTEALRNRTLPKKLTIFGGGYIGVELGHAYHALGSKVSYVTRGGFLGRVDTDIREEFTKVFTNKLTVYDNVNTKHVDYKNKTFTVTIENKGRVSKVKSDALLVATGVRPNNDLLGLENTSIKTNKFGFVKVDKFLETTMKGVYALGDCAGNYMFRHSANFEAEYLFPHLTSKKKKQAIKYPPMPWSVFTSPQIAGVGVTEDELKEKGRAYVKGVHNYINSGMGQALRSEYGFVKLLFAKGSKKLIGAHIIGHEASTLIHQLIYAITFEATVDDLLKMVYVHPALPEIVRNAAKKAKAQF